MTHALRSYDSSPSESLYIAEPEHSFSVEDLMAALSKLRNQSLNQLVAEVAAGASRNGWDGPGSRAVSVAAVRNAPVLVRLLPSFLPLPDVYATPTGELVFAWEAGENELTVLLSDNRVGFASVINGEDDSEMHPFTDDNLPAPIFEAARAWGRGRH